VATADRREQDRARRKQEILLAARAVFVQVGFRRATVDAVARRAEVGKGTIYLYFENKEAILAELLLQALGELAGQLQAASDSCPVLHSDQRLRALADAYLAFVQNAPDYFWLLNAFDRGDFQQGISPQRREQLFAVSHHTLELVRQAIADGMALEMFAPGDAWLAAGVLWAALNGALALMANPIRRTLVATDLPTFYHATVEAFLRGLRREV